MNVFPFIKAGDCMPCLGGTKRLDLLPDADHQFTRREDFHQMTTSISDWLVTHLTIRI